MLLTSTDTTEWKSYVVYGAMQTSGGTTLNHLAGKFPDYTRPAGDINGDGLADLVYLNRHGVDGINKKESRWSMAARNRRKLMTSILRIRSASVR